MLAFQIFIPANASRSKLKLMRTPLSNRRRRVICTRLARPYPLQCSSDTPKETSTISDTQSHTLLENATIVNVQLPLDLYLEETKDGKVFIDELIAGGSGESSGLLREGDVIVAVSLPFGDGLSPVPEDDGIEMIAEFIETRAEKTFSLAVVRTESVERLRMKLEDDEQNSVAVSKMRDLMREIFIPEYPIERPDEEDLNPSDPNFQPNLESLRKYGFNLDDIDFDSHLNET